MYLQQHTTLSSVVFKLFNLHSPTKKRATIYFTVGLQFLNFACKNVEKFPLRLGLY